MPLITVIAMNATMQMTDMTIAWTATKRTHCWGGLPSRITKPPAQVKSEARPAATLGWRPNAD